MRTASLKSKKTVVKVFVEGDEGVVVVAAAKCPVTTTNAIFFGLVKGRVEATTWHFGSEAFLTFKC